MNSRRNVFPPFPMIIERIKGVPKLADFVERVEKLRRLTTPKCFGNVSHTSES